MSRESCGRELRGEMTELMSRKTVIALITKAGVSAVNVQRVLKTASENIFLEIRKKTVSYQVTTDHGISDTSHLAPGMPTLSKILELSVDVLKNLAEAHGDLSSLSSEDVLKELSKRVTSTMTDCMVKS